MTINTDLLMRLMAPCGIDYRWMALRTAQVGNCSQQLRRKQMFAITGITGKVGGAVARDLLAANQPVRAVVRDVRKGEAWAQRGCDLVEADINDADALASAFKGAEGVFVLVPPSFDPSPGLPRGARNGCQRLKIGDRDAARPGRWYTCRQSAPKRLDRTCSPSTPSSNKRWESCRCRLLFCGQAGSWRTPAGTSLQ